MSVVVVYKIESSGIFVPTRTKTEDDRPGLVVVPERRWPGMSPRPGRIYSLVSSPMVPLKNPGKVNTWDEATKYLPPTDKSRVGKQVIIVDDHSWIPAGIFPQTQKQVAMARRVAQSINDAFKLAESISGTSQEKQRSSVMVIMSLIVAFFALIAGIVAILNTSIEDTALDKAGNFLEDVGENYLGVQGAPEPVEAPILPGAPPTPIPTPPPPEPAAETGEAPN